MLPYAKMYHGATELKRLYRGGTLIWEKPEPPSPFMPHMDTVTNYYDCKRGLTAATWENQIPAGDDVTWTGMQIQPDGAVGVYGTQQSYGRFTSAYNPDRTIYAIFKMPLIGNVQSNPHIVGSCGGSLATYRAGRWFTIAVEGYAAVNTVQTDQWGIGAGSNVTCEDYHVACVTRTSRGANVLYVDGVTKATMSNSQPYSDNFGVGVIIDANGEIGIGPTALQQILFVAVADTAHTAAQVAANSAWLRAYYELDAEYVALADSGGILLNDTTGEPLFVKNI